MGASFMASEDPDPESRQTVVLVKAKDRAKTDLVALMSSLARESDRPLGAILKDHVVTSFGRSKLSFDEFLALRLFDAKRYAGVDLRSFVGLRAMRGIWGVANFRLEFLDVIRNKITMTAMLEAHGFPSIPIDAFFCLVAGRESTKCLRSRSALKAYLTTRAPYPLFGKPMHGLQSLGSARLLACDASAGVLRFRDGSERAVDAFVSDIAAHYADGYCFQRHVSPHPDTLAICGDRLATVRIVTLMRSDGPIVWRACEKLPAGENVADNYWRVGNLLVELDVVTGRRGRATSGVGFSLQEHERHPDSGGAVTGTMVPNWTATRELALEAARAFKDTALIGWDIAPVEGGALVVEGNATPDLFLPQLSERRGALDHAFQDFLKERDRLAKTWKRQVRRESLASHRPSWA